MKSPEEFMPTIEACLQNADNLIAAAKASAVPGSYHIVFHLATMALEEIGKSSMIFIDAIDHKPVGDDEETKMPLKWIDDHERNLFWAIWLPGCESLRDWHTIPAATIAISQFTYPVREYRQSRWYPIQQNQVIYKLRVATPCIEPMNPVSAPYHQRHLTAPCQAHVASLIRIPYFNGAGG
jgi:AbiV family abortive infection protein